MVKQNNWLYNISSTREHPIAKKFNVCLEKINDITIREGATKSYFSHEIAINLDKIERELAKTEKRDPRKTMDITFCISAGKITNIVLIEFRLNYANPNNIKKTEIEEKVEHSRDIVSYSIAIHNTSYYIFSGKVKQQAYNKLRRLYNNKLTHIAIDLVELKNLFFKNNLTGKKSLK